jgi:hypothetical protein
VFVPFFDCLVRLFVRVHPDPLCFSMTPEAAVISSGSGLTCSSLASRGSYGTRPRKFGLWFSGLLLIIYIGIPAYSTYFTRRGVSRVDRTVQSDWQSALLAVAIPGRSPASVESVLVDLAIAGEDKHYMYTVNVADLFMKTSRGTRSES